MTRPIGREPALHIGWPSLERGARPARAWLVAALTSLAATSPVAAWGAPQISAGVEVGGGATDLRTDPAAAFWLGARGDVLFLRRGDRDMALGPYVEVLGRNFDDFEAGGGLSWLIPLTDQVPLILSAGAHARGGAFGWEPGVDGGFFIGSRSYDFHSIYGYAIGVFVQGRYGLGDGQQADVWGGLYVDGEILALPFVLLYAGIFQ